MSYARGMRTLRAIGTVDADTLARLAPATSFDTLEDLLAWTHDLVEVIVQDEFTHDVVMRVAPAYLAFDTT
jgi:hypothetical protein